MSIAAAPQRRLHLVAVCHQMQPQDFAVKLHTLAARRGFGLRGVVVSNNAAHPLPGASGELRFLRGSNELLDFSGYFEGLEHLLSVWPQAANDNLLFVNDTLVTKHAAGCILGHVLGLDALLRQLQLAAIGGKLDPYRAICLKNPWSGHAGYVTSFCFMLNPAGLPLLRRLPAEAEAANLSSELGPGDEGWARSMPQDLRELIRAHLIYQGSPLRWPRAGSVPPALIRSKAYCAFFEHRLSGLFGQAGAIVPINAGPRSAAAIATRERIAAAIRAVRASAGLER